ncbi:hypothetical protein BDY19DRAFT_76393 [Irpex rosettiformis]|uniref:Uncharacterized protein n=1 Tax=Irpex rosettiformis TaxID=378272 RepID=A0ACB8ULI8_9APHY|nr:hypothetical protein BDY19DRAFT_76393 [Irpex rosettiformis]
MPRTNRTDTNSSSHLSPTSSQPTWAPPRTPLSPHRLAKLANVFGVPTPIPATHPHAFSVSSSTPVSSPSPSPLPHEMMRRSPTPSGMSSPALNAFSTSKYMLHVIPPMSLPHDFDEIDLTLPPPTASGYHSHFQRGVLVPLYSTFQSQLAAIAREYALPSTTGIELFLSSSLNTDDSKEPGARLSELIWKHIWTRVITFEKDELLTPGPKPLGLGMNYNLASKSTPSLLQDITSSSVMSLSSVISPRLTETPQPMISTTTPAPSTPSQSVYTSQSERDTPESASSIEPPHGVDSLPLPGLGSHSLLPVLARVEFEIDKHKARWYDAWLNSRKINFAKRAESRQGGRNGSRSEQDEEGEMPSKAPIDLALVGKMNGISPSPNLFLTTEASTEPEELVLDDEGYRQLEEDSEDSEDRDEDDEEGEEGRIDDGELAAALDGRDPLEDVFGKDEDTWNDINHSGEKTRQSDSNVVDLALDASALSRIPDNLEADDLHRMSPENAEAEVDDLLEKMGKPELFVSIPDSPNKRQSSPTTASTTKKRIPPPITIMRSASGNELVVPEQPTPLTGSTDGAHLAYLSTPSPSSSPEKHTSDDEDTEDGDNSVTKVRSPEDDKRAGVFYDDLDLGLDPSLTAEGEYDESDPYDRRKSQYIMAAELDVLEKSLAQFSPRRLQSIDLKPEDFSPTLHAQRGSQRSPSIASLLSPRKQTNFDTPTKSPAGASWPAVPYSALNGNDNEFGDDDDRVPSPPTFAFNGISTEPPKAFSRQREDSDLISNETLARQRALEEERGLYPPLVAPSMLALRRHGDSPIIPLSPDPFGRFPSEAESAFQGDEYLGTIPEGGGGLGIPAAVLDEIRPPSQAPSSRFSLDSVTSEEAPKPGPSSAKSSGALSGVKTIRRLWRRSESKRASVSSVAQPSSGRTSPNTAVPQNSQSARTRSKSVSRTPPASLSPSVAEMPTKGLYIPAMPSQESLRDSVRQPREPVLQSLRFDQESPYPIHPSRAVPMHAPSPPPGSRPPSQQTNRPPSTASQAPPGSPPERNSVRKSILKSWKSVNGLSSSTKGAKNGSPSSTPRSSNEQLPDTLKKRRPSVIDFATGALRGSAASGPGSLGELPPSPAIPEQFAIQMRSPSRASQLSHTNGKLSVSSSILASSPPQTRSPMTVATSPPRNGLVAQQRASVESYESRPSFDVSQFEIVSPPPGKLTYPYHGLDTPMAASQE